jgi:hypothetical protein
MQTVCMRSILRVRSRYCMGPIIIHGTARRGIRGRDIVATTTVESKDDGKELEKGWADTTKS